MFLQYSSLINDGWQFCKTDIDEDIVSLTNMKWYNAELPHDWLINDTKKLYETGCGWYKRTIEVSEKETSGDILIYFEGVYMDSTVYVNGVKAFEWKYGYSSFEANITDFVTAGENTIIVSVRHRSPNTRWYSGAGIFRNVWLRKCPKSHIVRNGVYVHSEKHGENWVTEIETEVASNTLEMYVKYSIADSAGNEIASTVTKKGCFNATLFPSNPKLWQLNDPKLYTLNTELYCGNEKIDSYLIEIGFRSVEWNCESGFWLNGENIKLHGVCMHHDLGALGSAVNAAAIERQLTIMKAMGVNAIRTSHNMPAVELMQLCDRIGLLVDSEAFDMWEGAKTEFDYARFFPEWSERDVESWVKRDRNHPSLIMWSIGNEIYDTHSSPRGLVITKMLKSYVLKNDPKQNGHVTIGSNYMQWENAQKCADELRVAGYNYAERLYSEHHEKYPDRVIYGSETASAVRSRGIYHFPANTPILTHDDMQCSDLDNSVVGWGSSAQKSWKTDRDCPFCCGQFIWTGFDYIGEPTPYSTKNSYFGIVDTAGLPKDIYYYYQSAWTSPETNPMVHILPYWDFNDGEEIDVIIYTNGAETELFLNGSSLGRQKINHADGENTCAQYRVKYKNGILKALAYDASGNVIATDTQNSFGDSERLVLKSNREKVSADGRDLVFFEISTVDKDGVFVANARNRVRITVSGEARLVGLDNGDSTDYDSYKGDNKRLFSGKLVAVVETTLTPGEFKVKAESISLESAELVMESSPCNPIDVNGFSVVTENAYPAAQTEYTDEIPVRKIELKLESGTRKLDENNRTAIVVPELFPKNTTYSDITWKIVKDNGVEVNCANVELVDGKAIVTAKGDGSFRLRTFCDNGGNAPEVFSDISFETSGLGDAVRNPYKFTAACLVNYSNIPVNSIENGALGGFDKRTEMTFTGIDFGKYGSEKILISIGNCNDDIPVELWDGAADESGRLIKTFMFAHNGRWDGFDPAEFDLGETISGVHSITLVIDKRVIFGGFQFIEKNKALEKLYSADNDGMYGDDFEIHDNRIEKIGNNVIINFNTMNFAEGVSSITINGKTPNARNSIQLRYTEHGGTEQLTQLIEFEKCSEYTEQRFSLKTIMGVNDISFIFLPGSNFDFKWFRFE